MIEKIVYDYLKNAFEDKGIPVYMEKPDDKEKEYVLIEKTSSSVENHVYRATFALQSYSDSLYGACLLNEEVKDKMDHIIDDTDVSWSELNSDYNYTDTTTKEYRYQAVYDLNY